MNEYTVNHDLCAVGGVPGSPEDPDNCNEPVTHVYLEAGIMPVGVCANHVPEQDQSPDPGPEEIRMMS